MSNEVYSMTGFGRAEADAGERLITVECRSVNQRFLDLRVRLPRDFSGWEGAFVQKLKKKFSRGKVEFFLSVTKNSGQATVECDFALAEAYHNTLKKMAEQLGLDQQIPIKMIAQMPEVFSPKASEEDSQALKNKCEKCLLDAADSLLKMRAEEGDFLRKDMIERSRTLETLQAGVEKAAPGRLKKFHDNLIERLKELAGDCNLEPNRLEQEAVVYADRSDITEELVRLLSHLKSWAATLSEGGTIGRKLDFLTQEIFREINTIGSKALDATISALVVEMKVEVEKMREQVQNIE
jgi:uncharacterized protein (TIGR00255 family)